MDEGTYTNVFVMTGISSVWYRKYNYVWKQNGVNEFQGSSDLFFAMYHHLVREGKYCAWKLESKDGRVPTSLGSNNTIGGLALWIFQIGSASPATTTSTNVQNEIETNPIEKLEMELFQEESEGKVNPSDRNDPLHIYFLLGVMNVLDYICFQGGLIRLGDILVFPRDFFSNSSNDELKNTQKKNREILSCEIELQWNNESLYFSLVLEQQQLRRLQLNDILTISRSNPLIAIMAPHANAIHIIEVFPNGEEADAVIDEWCHVFGYSRTQLTQCRKDGMPLVLRCVLQDKELLIPTECLFVKNHSYLLDSLITNYPMQLWRNISSFSQRIPTKQHGRISLTADNFMDVDGNRFQDPFNFVMPNNPEHANILTFRHPPHPSPNPVDMHTIIVSEPSANMLGGTPVLDNIESQVITTHLNENELNDYDPLADLFSRDEQSVPKLNNIGMENIFGAVGVGNMESGIGPNAMVEEGFQAVPQVNSFGTPLTINTTDMKTPVSVGEHPAIATPIVTPLTADSNKSSSTSSVSPYSLLPVNRRLPLAYAPIVQLTSPERRHSIGNFRYVPNDVNANKGSEPGRGTLYSPDAIPTFHLNEEEFELPNVKRLKGGEEPNDIDNDVKDGASSSSSSSSPSSPSSSSSSSDSSSSSEEDEDSDHEMDDEKDLHSKSKLSRFSWALFSTLMIPEGGNSLDGSLPLPLRCLSDCNTLEDWLILTSAKNRNTMPTVMNSLNSEKSRADEFPPYILDSIERLLPIIQLVALSPFPYGTFERLGPSDYYPRPQGDSLRFKTHPSVENDSPNNITVPATPQTPVSPISCSGIVSVGANTDSDYIFASPITNANQLLKGWMAMVAYLQKAVEAPLKGPLTIQQLHDHSDLSSTTYGRFRKKKTGEKILENFGHPHVVVGNDGDWLHAAVDIVFLWDKLSLEPYSPAKDVRYIAIIPDTDVVLSTLGFFGELNSVFETCNLGKHRPLCEYSFIKVPNLGNADISSKREIYLQTCRNAVPTIIEYCNKTKTDYLVIYMVNPFNDNVSLYHLSYCFLAMLNELKVQNIPFNIVLQIIPWELISYPLNNFENVLKDIAFSVYQKCPLRLRSHHYPNVMECRACRDDIYAPPFILSNQKPPKISIVANCEEYHVPSVVIENVLHIVFKYIGNTYFVCVWTDQNGEMLKTKIFPSTNKLGVSIWKQTLLILNKSCFRWKVIICKYGTLTLNENKDLVSAFQEAHSKFSSVSIAGVNFIHSMQFLPVPNSLSAAAASATQSSRPLLNPLSTPMTDSAAASPNNIGSPFLAPTSAVATSAASTSSLDGNKNCCYCFSSHTVAVGPYTKSSVEYPVILANSYLVQHFQPNHNNTLQISLTFHKSFSTFSNANSDGTSGTDGDGSGSSSETTPKKFVALDIARQLHALCFMNTSFYGYYSYEYHSDFSNTKKGHTTLPAHFAVCQRIFGLVSVLPSRETSK